MGSLTNLRTGRALFAFFFALYALTSSGNAFRVPDEFEAYFQTEHLADAGDISVPQTLSIRQDGQPIFFGEFGRDGKPYAPYGPGLAYLILPFHLAGRAVAALAGVHRLQPPDGAAWEFLVGGLTTLSMAFFAALAIAGFHRASVALGASPRRALGMSLLLGTGTVLWVYATTLYSEALLAACFIWAAALLLEARTATPTRARSRVFTAAGLIAIAGLAKPTALVIAPAFVCAVLLQDHIPAAGRRRTVMGLAGAILVATAVQLAWNVWRFGAALDFGYNLGAMVPYPPARSFALAEIPRGLAVQLLSPGKSTFVWAPALILSMTSLRDTWRRERGLVAGAAIAYIVALLFYAAFLYPEGGYAHGPRHLVPLVPLGLLPAVAARRVPRRLFALCAAVGIAVCATAVSVSFLEDQSPPDAARSSGPYYERIDPEPGRPWNRYRLEYIPFKTALGSGHWLDSSRPPGNGPDFFVVHLARVRQRFPGGSEIPASLPWAIAILWTALLAWSGRAIGRRARENQR